MCVSLLLAKILGYYSPVSTALCCAVWVKRVGHHLDTPRQTRQDCWTHSSTDNKHKPTTLLSSDRWIGCSTLTTDSVNGYSYSPSTTTAVTLCVFVVKIILSSHTHKHACSFITIDIMQCVLPNTTATAAVNCMHTPCKFKCVSLLPCFDNLLHF